MTRPKDEQQFSPRPRAPKGYRPANLGPAHIEHVLSITMTLAAEVVALREKLDSVIRLNTEKPSFTAADVEAYEASPAAAAERAAWRQAYLSRLLRILYEEIPEENAPIRDQYSAFVEEIAN